MAITLAAFVIIGRPSTSVGKGIDGLSSDEKAAFLALSDELQFLSSIDRPGWLVTGMMFGSNRPPIHIYSSGTCVNPSQAFIQATRGISGVSPMIARMEFANCSQSNSLASDFASGPVEIFVAIWPGGRAAAGIVMPGILPGTRLANLGSRYRSIAAFNQVAVWHTGQLDSVPPAQLSQ